MQPVKVDEPTVEETITILKFKRNTKTTITSSALDAAIEAAANSNRYIQALLLPPDKAIDPVGRSWFKMNLTPNFADPK